tara:strand:- start:59 stop:385 length:327 start_codon:yes stop_codon:yes gene_type:complete
MTVIRRFTYQALDQLANIRTINVTTDDEFILELIELNLILPTAKLRKAVSSLETQPQAGSAQSDFRLQAPGGEAQRPPNRYNQPPALTAQSAHSSVTHPSEADLTVRI